MYTAWPGAEKVVWTRGLTNEDSEKIKRLVLYYDPDIPCHVFNIEKGRYRHWVALTQQFYHNDGYYYEVTNFSNALLALSLIEEGLQEPNYMDIERQVREAQDETTIATLGEDKKREKMKEDYQCRWYCEGERGDAEYILKSELLFHGSEMVTAPVRSKTAKRKREDNTTALKKQKQLAALKDKISAKSWNMLNCHRKDRKKQVKLHFRK